MKKKDSVPLKTPVETPVTAKDAAGTGDARSPTASFPIVGVGASAGGLEAFTQLLNALPLDTGMGFVLVQHLDPEHDSALTEILSRATSMPVCDVTDNQAVEPNHVYIIPPDTNLSILDGMLKLQPRPKTRSPHRPIDSFFESLAVDHHERAIGVVLSGTASDGTVGLEAIKAQGGITFAQDDSAKYDSMPRSAVMAGCVDLVLSPKQLAQEIARIAKHPYVAGQPLELSARVPNDLDEVTAHQDNDPSLPSGKKGSRRTGALPARAERGRGEKAGAKDADDGYTKTLSLLCNHTGVDFSLYKPNTIERRIARRLVISKRNTLEEYATFLQGNAKELDALCSDVLISVTSFFRNSDVFEALQRDVLPELLKQPGDDPIRVWVPGCSTGQEAYSIAIAFMEAAEKSPRGRNLQIFATDLNERLLEKGRYGLYPKSLAEEISPERLRRFFVAEQGGYRVSKLLRESVIFARQNLFADPPFSRMDLISCRNLLIYLGPSLQRKAIPTFHYALKPRGFLLLGQSESTGSFTELFEPVDKKAKIYSRKEAPTPAFHMPASRERGTRASTGQWAPAVSVERPQPKDSLGGELNAQREADRITAHQFAPPGVLVDAALQVLQFRGPTGAFLEPPVGKASFNVLKMARDGLMLPLRVAIDEAKKENKATRRDNVHVKQDGEIRAVNLEVIPLKNLSELCYLILFEEASAASATQSATQASRGASAPGLSDDTAEPGGLRHPARQKSASAAEVSSRIVELETELAQTREYLAAMQDQYEASSEELQAASEEVQSANEELQSINEELETSKEELESSNEELTTVNEEMSQRNSELNVVNNDLMNFQSSTRLVVLLLGRDLTIRRFSPQAEKQFNLVAADVGRPISHIRHNLVLPDEGKTPLDLETLCTEVITTVSEKERDVLDKDGHWHSLRLRPYTTLDHKIDGAVLLLLEIDELKQSEQAVAAARDYAENVIENLREPLVVLDSNLRVERANRNFYCDFRVEPGETIGTFIYELGNKQWDIPRLRELLEEILPQSKTIEGFEVEHDFEQLGRRTMLLNARTILNPRQKTERILLSVEDITERKRTEAAMAHLAAVVTSSGDSILTQDLNGVISSWNRGAELLFGYTEHEVVGQSVTTFIPPDRLDEHYSILDQICRGGPTKNYETVRQKKDGTLIDVSMTVSPLKNEQGQIIGASKIARDITEHKRLQIAQKANNARFETLFNSSPVGIYLVDAEMRFRLVNRQARPVFGNIGDLIGRDFVEVVRLVWPRDSADDIIRRFRHTLETGESYTASGFSEERNDRKVREYYDWQIHRMALPDGQHGVVCYFVDISARVIAEEKLHASEALYRRLFETAKDGVLILDANSGRILEANPFMTELSGYTTDEFIGKELWEIGLFRDTAANEAAFRELQRNGYVRYDHLPLKSKSGEPAEVEFVSNVYQWDHRQVAQCNIRDISSRSRLERQTQKQASELSDLHRRKDEFLAMLSHELRSPLAPIANAVQLLGLQEGSENLMQKQARSIIERQMKQLKRLVDDLLEVSRITSGRVQLRRERVVVSRIVEGAVETARPLIEQRHHEFIVSIPPEQIWLDADITRLEQVLVNLLTNAAKYTSEGGSISLTVELSTGVKGTAPATDSSSETLLSQHSTTPVASASPLTATECVIRVRDTGVGISPELLPHVFDLFTQAERSLDRSQGGLGIGLALVQRLTNLHGGTVEAHSEAGQGSEFIVRLPLAAPEATQSELLVSATNQPTTRPLRVLVVDDNIDTVSSFSMLLRASGHHVRTAHDGLAAVQAALEYQPDAVLLDIGLPVLNGYEVAKSIRQEPTLKDIVLIALTGYGQETDRQAALQAGFNHHLVKPAHLEQLQTILATVSVNET